MSMTWEEAIALLNEQYETCKRIYDCSADQIKSYPNVPKFMEALGMALSALRPVSLEQVEKVWRGKWVPEMNCFSVAAYHTCSKCGEIAETVETGDEQLSDFCPFCGAPMTDEAVEITMRRLEALNEED